MSDAADRLPLLRRVESTSVDAIGYDPDTRRLYIRFVGSRRAYVYYNVGQTVFDALIAADSKGRFVNREIKDAYAYRRL